MSDRQTGAFAAVRGANPTPPALEHPDPVVRELARVGAKLESFSTALRADLDIVAASHREHGDRLAAFEATLRRIADQGARAAQDARDTKAIVESLSTMVVSLIAERQVQKPGGGGEAP